MLCVDRTPVAAMAHALATEHFAIEGADLLIGGLRVHDLAVRFGTPLYVYDAAVMRRSYRALAQALSGFAEVYFSIKANPNPAIAALFVAEGAGIEVASGAEYLRALSAGCLPGRILFAGPGKRMEEIVLALNSGIEEIHLESADEIESVSAAARELGIVAPVAIRVNPVATAQGGAMRMGGKPSPFGFDEETLEDVVRTIAADRRLDLCGIHMFAGTQILDADILAAQWTHGIAVAARVAEFSGAPLKSIDLGGGLGIPYYVGETALDLNRLAAHAATLREQVRAHALLRSARIVVEPGRFLAGPGGLYVARVTAAKISRGQRFLIADGGMNHHLAASGNLGQIVKRDFPILAPARMDEPARGRCVVAGPLCTPLDMLARQADLPELERGDLVAVLQSGAYGLSASPAGFLSHPMPAEVLVDSGNACEIRVRGSFETPLTALP